MPVYLDTSVLNRPFDDLRAPRVREEAEAVAKLVTAIEERRAILVTSEYLAFEVSQSPYPDRLAQVRSVLRLPGSRCPLGRGSWSARRCWSA